MSVEVARYARRLQFSAGPQTHVFYACEQHRDRLVDGTAGGPNFFAILSEPVKNVEPGGDIECAVCRGEEGP